jgi:hypothetical protein
MNLQELFNKNDNKKVDTDGLYGAQCTDLINQYRTDVIGTPAFGIQYAKDIYAKGQAEYYDKIPNSPTAVPQFGDIIVWNGNVAAGVGHVAIAKGVGDTNRFDSFDQNWPSGSPCHFQNHDYKNVTGWLRPKNQQAISGTPPPPQVDPKDAIIADLTNKLDEANRLDATLSQQLKDKTAEATRLEEEKKVLEANVELHKATISELTDTVSDRDTIHEADLQEIAGLKVRLKDCTKEYTLGELLNMIWSKIKGV